ncbi:MAG: TetR/AcrR family transcriptional regulator [Flavobacteriales bacterium]
MIDYTTLTGKQQKRYDRIVHTAEDMMYQQSFYKISLSELTNALSVSRSTIYEYFDSKEGLIETVVNTISDRLNNSLTEIVGDDDMNIHDKFIQLAKAQSLNLNANCYRLLNDLKTHMPHIYAKFHKGRNEREQNGYRKLIEQGIKEGVFASHYDKDFLVQLYLKMGQLTGDTDILDQIRMNKLETMETIINVFLKGTKKQ